MIDELSDFLLEQLGQCLLHEDLALFREAMSAHLAHDDEGDISQHPLYVVLPVLFHSLPKSANQFSFTGVKLPGRNDPCNCGSGKKTKKCCSAMLDFPTPSAIVLFNQALSGLSDDDFIELANKPNWNIKAATQYFPYAIELEHFQQAADIGLGCIKPLSKIRNEHQDFISYLLDALFDSGQDSVRIDLMKQLSALNHANSIQSIAHQRLAMIAGQQGDNEAAQYELQQAFRSDPDQVELPMAELSILGMVADDAEIKSRAKFWKAKLTKKYGDDYPALEFLNQVVKSGKALFDDYQQKLDSDDDELFDSIATEIESQVQENALRLANAFSSDVGQLNYDLTLTGNEAKLKLKKDLKQPFKVWMSLFEENSQEVLSVYSHDISFDDLNDLRWDISNKAWVDYLCCQPELLSNVDVLEQISSYISQAPTPIEDDDEADPNKLSILSKIQLAYQHFNHRAINNVILSVPKGITLPERFKANKKFWRLCQDYYLHVNEYEGAQQHTIEYLHSVLALDPQELPWVVEALCMLYFELDQAQKTIELLEATTKHTMISVYLLAYAYHQNGDSLQASEQLLRIQKKNKKLSKTFSNALKNKNYKPLMNTQVIKLYNLLVSGDFPQACAWFERQLPNK